MQQTVKHTLTYCMYHMMRLKFTVRWTDSEFLLVSKYTQTPCICSSKRTHYHNIPHSDKPASKSEVGCARAILRFWRSCCATPAYSIEWRSTSQVWGRPWPPLHLVSPLWTASSMFWGWSSKQVCIVGASSPTPSRTALPLSAARLLTCFLNSMR